ncbi:MAG: SEC-C domain-containing protein [Tepidibacter sp.]|uniref:YecA family protein n=1 Tax=Tepidibacter sp. TaxID=2529387 RepID=UPI0025CCA345|nr:SEC-C domain-containing protein [Tepidibacter sp.]MCT4509439.1 SEC-C domain-containing protein [Tepidibacter sp.]
MVGRNDLCPCNSGKKYKKCCLNKDKKNSMLKQKADFSQKHDISVTQKLYAYSRKDKFYDEYMNAQHKFYIVDDKEINSKFNSFFNTYYLQDYITNENKTIAISFFEENKNKLNVIEKNILKSKLKSYITIYKILNIEEDKAVLKDLILDKETYVEDINVLKDLKVGEVVIGRTANIVEVNKFIDTVLSISEKIKDVIIADIKNIYEKNKDVYKSMETFLIYNTNIFYKYIQQLIDPKIGEYLKEKNIEKQSDTKKINDSQEECGVEKLITENIEDAYKEVALTIWEEYKNNNEVKGTENGWASAVEYHTKKEDGINVTQSAIAKKYKVSPSTLGKRYKEIKLIHQI